MAIRASSIGAEVWLNAYTSGRIRVSSVGVAAWTGAAPVGVGGTEAQLGQPLVISLRHEGGILYLRVNNGADLAVYSGDTSNLTASLQLAMSAAGLNANMKFFECATFDCVPSLGTRDAIEQDFMRWIGVGGIAPPTSNVAWDVPTSGPGMLFTNNNLTCTEGTSRLVPAIAVDLGAKLIWLRDPFLGKWNNSNTANPATGIGGISYSVAGVIFPMFSGYGSAGGDQTSARFANSLLTRRPPAGFSAWDVLVAGVTTWNPSDKDAAVALSNGNLTAAQTSVASSWRSVRATAGLSTGKAFWECTTDLIDSNSGWLIGFGNASANLASYAGSNANSVGWQATGTKYENAAGSPGTTNALSPPGSADSAWKRVQATLGYAAGKRVFEIKIDQVHVVDTTGIFIGVADASCGYFPGIDTHGVGYQSNTDVSGAGVWYNNLHPTYLAKYATAAGLTIMVAVDCDNKKVWFFHPTTANWNNDTLANQNPSTNIGGYSLSTLSGLIFPTLAYFYDSGTANRTTANFAGPFVNAIPGGYLAWASDAAWSPLSLSSLDGWYQGDLLSGANNSTIATWPDSSGQGHNATGVGTPKLKTALLNGLNAVNSDGSGHFNVANLLSSANGTNGAAAVMVLRSNQLVGNANGGPLSIGSDDTLWNHYPYVDTNIYDDFGANARKAANVANALNAWHIGSFHAKTAVWQYYKDGTVITNQGSNTFGISSAPMFLRSIRNTDNTYYYFIGDIAEIIICKSVMTQDEREKSEGYLAHKWGIASVLPSGHPYKSAPP